MKTKSDIIRITTELKDKIILLQNTYPKTNKILIETSKIEKRIRILKKSIKYIDNKMNDTKYKELSSNIEYYLNHIELHRVQQSTFYISICWEMINKVNKERKYVCEILDNYFLDSYYNRWNIQFKHAIKLLYETYESEFEKKYKDSNGNMEINLEDIVKIKLRLRNYRI